MLCRFLVYERLYAEGSGAKDASTEPNDVVQLRQHFEDAAVELLRTIVELQARAACQCSRNSVVRYFRDVFKADDWLTLSKSIKEGDAACTKYIQALHADEFDRRMKEQSQKMALLDDAVNHLVDLQKQILHEIRAGFSKQEGRFNESEHLEALKVLWTSNDENHKRLIPVPVPGTCRWFTGHAQYEKFKTATNSDVLWLSADPGCGKSVIARWLIDQDTPQGAHKVDVKDRRGRTALSWVCTVRNTGNVDTAKVLLSHGADVNMPDIEGKRPLYYASSTAEDPTLVKFLLEQGATDPKALEAAIFQSAEVGVLLLNHQHVLPDDMPQCHNLLEQAIAWRPSPWDPDEPLFGDSWHTDALYVSLVEHLLMHRPAF